MGLINDTVQSDHGEFIANMATFQMFVENDKERLKQQKEQSDRHHQIQMLKMKGLFKIAIIISTGIFGAGGLIALILGLLGS